MSEKDKKKDEVETTAEGTEENKDEEDGVEVTEKKTKTRKLQINISRDKEVEALQREKAELESRLKKVEEEGEERKQKMEDEKTTIQEQLDEKQAILEKQALEAFEKDKNELLTLAKNSKLTDEQMADIEARLTTPEKLEMVKGLMTMLVPKEPEKTEEGKEEKKVPDGKASIVPPVTRDGSKVYDSPEALISDLYWKAYYARDNQVTVQERRDARDKIEKLMADMIGGKGWKELKEGMRMPEGKISYCPKCYQVIIGTPDKCPHCGHDLQEKLRKQEEESSKW